MNVLLRWNMPRSYMAERNRQMLKRLLRLLVIVILIIFAASQVALNYLAHIDAGEAQRVAPTFYLIIALSPLVFLPYIRLAFPVHYALTEDDLKEEGDPVQRWSNVESYTFEDSEIVSDVRVLKIKMKGRKGFFWWPFDPAEVDEAQIAQIFEEQMARHRSELLGD